VSGVTGGSTGGGATLIVIVFVCMRPLDDCTESVTVLAPAVEYFLVIVGVDPMSPSDPDQLNL